MLLKNTIKLLIAFAGIILMNLIFFSLIDSNIDPLQENLTKFTHFLKGHLFKYQFGKFHYSITISVILFVAYLIWDYWEGYQEASSSIKDVVSSSFGFFWICLLSIIGTSLAVVIIFAGFELFYTIIIQYPINRGWSLLIDDNYSRDFNYFQFPTIYYYGFQQSHTGFELFHIILSSTFFWLLLFLLFEKKPLASNKNPSTLKGLACLKDRFHPFYKYFYFVSTIYILPLVFVWVYPIMLQWFGKMPNHSDVVAPVRNVYYLGVVLFLLQGIYFAVRLFSNHKRISRSNNTLETRNNIIQSLQKKNYDKSISLFGKFTLYKKGNELNSVGTMYFTPIENNMFIVTGVNWLGIGEWDGSSGYYNWRFENGETGKTSFDIMKNNTIAGKVKGDNKNAMLIGLDWEYIAKKEI